MKKLSIILGSVMSAMFVGCSSYKVDPYTSGVLQGKVVYLAYQKVAEKQSEDFKKKVAEIYKIMNNLGDDDKLEENCKLITQLVDELAKDKMTDADAKMLAAVARDLLKQLNKIIEDKAAKDSDAVKFLTGVRDGINSMVESYGN